MKLIVTCKPNIASMNIRKVLLEKYPFKETEETFDGNHVHTYKDYQLILSEKPVLELDYLKDYFEPEIYLICSTHASKVHMQTISVHPTGNWGDAEKGGKEKELCLAPTGFLKNCLEKLKDLAEEKKVDYDITYEVTHHGPTGMNAPLAFIEVGSTEKEWNDMAAIEIAAEAVFASTESDGISAFGVGGTHYAPKFQGIKIKPFAIGHMCPKYAIEYLNEEMFLKAMECCVPRAHAVLIDWKGLKGEDRNRVISYAKKEGIEIVRL